MYPILKQHAQLSGVQNLREDVFEMHFQLMKEGRMQNVMETDLCLVMTLIAD